jgi:hypothetical protein
VSCSLNVLRVSVLESVLEEFEVGVSYVKVFVVCVYVVKSVECVMNVNDVK